MASHQGCIADPKNADQLLNVKAEHLRRMQDTVKVLKKLKKDGILDNQDVIQFIGLYDKPCDTYTQQPAIARLKHIAKFSHKFDETQKNEAKSNLSNLFATTRTITQVYVHLDQVIDKLKIKPFKPSNEKESAIRNTAAIFQAGIPAPVTPLTLPPASPAIPDSGLSAVPSVPRLIPRVEQDRHGVIANSKNEIRVSIEQLRNISDGKQQAVFNPLIGRFTIVQFTGDTVTFFNEINDKINPKISEKVLFNSAGDILQIDKLNSSGQWEIRGRNQITPEDYVDSAFKLSVFAIEIDLIIKKKLEQNNKNSLKA
jgi:hypothetical protein